MTISTSNADPEGGETVVLETSAQDETDGSLEASLSCDGGNLRGSFLDLPVTDVASTVSCTASATDAAGNFGSASIDIEVRETTVSLEISDLFDDVAQGQVLAISTDGLTPAEDDYVAELGGRSVTLHDAVSGGLSVLVPLDMPVGPQRLDFEVDERRYSFEIDVVAQPTVNDPETYLRDTLTSTLNGIDALLSDPAFELSERERTEIQQGRDGVQTAIENIDTATTDDIVEAAAYLASNARVFEAANEAQRVLAALTANEATGNCLDPALGFAREMARTAVMTAAIVGATLGTVGIPIISGPIGVYGFYRIFERIDSPKGAKARAASVWNCLSDASNADHELRTTSTIAQKYRDPVYAEVLRAEQAILAFEHRAPTGVELRRLVAGEAAETFYSGIDELTSVLDPIPFFPESYKGLFDRYVEDRVSTLTTEVTLDSISRSDISGRVSQVPGGLQAEFVYDGDDRDALDPGIDFSISMSHQGVSVGSFNARLSAIPLASDIMATVDAGLETLIDTQAFGARLEIVDQPSKGSVSVIDRSTVQYTAFDDAFGEDSFTFQAVIGNQRSTTATAFLDIIGDPLAGAVGEWEHRLRLRSVGSNCDNTDRSPGVWEAWSGTTTFEVSRDMDTYTLDMGFGVLDFDDGGPDVSRSFGDADNGPGVNFKGSWTVSDSEFIRTADLDVSVVDSDRMDGGIVLDYDFSPLSGGTCRNTYDIEFRKN